MQKKLKKLNALYSELLIKQKKLDAAKAWASYNYLFTPNFAFLLKYQQDVLNTQNAIENIMFSLMDERGDEFMIVLEEIICLNSKDVKPWT